jgi:hypothetical protein
MKLLFLLVLSGCTTQSLDSLYLERALRPSAKLDALISRREDARARRNNAKMPCPQGYTAYCDSMRDRGCGQRMPREPVEYICISREQLNRL